MKKFLFKVFIYALLLASITEAANLYYKKRMGYGTEMKIPDGIQICNFGTSHGGSFNYEDFQKDYVCFSFAMAEQTLLYDYRILQNYKDKIQPGAIVFILVSHFSIFGKSDVESGNFASKNKRYYRFLPPELIEQYDGKTAFYVKYFPALAADNLVRLFEILSPFAFSKPDTAPHEANHHDAIPQAEKRYVNFIAVNVDGDGTRIRKQDGIDALYKMISLCREIGATPILITTPLLSEYIDLIKKNDPKFFDDFRSVIDEVVKNTGIKYYDYSMDENYLKAYELFGDVDHLNKQGARIFTDNLLSEVLGIKTKAP